MAVTSVMLTSLTVAFQIAAGTPAPAVRSSPDSAKLVRSVRSAQASFEAYRRTRLPRGETGTGECDVHIGRYCYWRGDDDGEQPPPENPAIRTQRDALIAQLDTVATILPGDVWVIGQEVRYLVEANRTDDALSATARCRAEASWCSALSGYALHKARQFEPADSVFRVALSQMSEPDRCRWLDISDIAESEVSDPARHMDCVSRERYVRRATWLGAPLWSVSSSDLLSEHFARQVRAKMAERSASVDGAFWADDERTLMIRYGWPTWFTQSDPSYGSQLLPAITGHDAGMPYYFLPTRHAIDSTSHLRNAEFALEEARAPSGYSPAYLRSIHPLSGQVAVFRRGDSAIVIAGWDASHDTTLTGRLLDVALALATTDSVVTVEREKAHNAGRILAIAPIDSGVASLEVLSGEDRRAGRLRIGIPAKPKTTIALSDLLFYAPFDAPAMTIDEARDSALVSDVIPASRAVGVFWEIYGLAPQAAPVKYSLEVEQVGVSWMRRAAERVGIAGRTTGLRVQWEEAPAVKNGVAPRGVKLDLSRLRRGRYLVTLVTATKEGLVATSSREIEVR